MVTNGELIPSIPTPKFAKRIIDFIGNFPYSLENISLGKQLYYARLKYGMTHEESTKEIEIE